MEGVVKVQVDEVKKIQLEILEMMACGHGGEEIADELGISYLEMGRERKRLYKAMGVSNGFAAIGIMSYLSGRFRKAVERRHLKMNKYKVMWFDKKNGDKKRFLFWARSWMDALNKIGHDVIPCTIYEKLGGKGDWILVKVVDKTKVLNQKLLPM